MTREIAKYMESHGEIRHGKEFQSYIPNPQKHNSLGNCFATQLSGHGSKASGRACWRESAGLPLID